MKKIFQIIALTFFVALGACSKDAATADINLSEQMLQDKTWFLDYSTTTTGTSSVIKTYVGQSTYFINFLKNKSTKDSDGLMGNYQIKKVGNKLQIFVTAKTIGSANVEYTYLVESVGAKDLVVSFASNSQTTKRYFSVR
jgi:hypothetical protein